MKYNIFFLLCFIVQFSIAQPDSLYIKKKNIVVEPTPKWENKNKGGIDLNEVAFVNWSSGGSNSISAILSVKSTLDYTYRDFVWSSSINSRYGINQQESQPLKKTDDLFELNSSLGYRRSKNSKWYYSARLNFKTQFANGYSYPDTSNPISKFMAPGYMFFGGGMEYGKDIKRLSLYVSPLTFKSTFVLDENLANAGAFGVSPAIYDDEGNVLVPGEKVREELGILVTNYYELDVAKNVSLKSTANFYTDYLNSFGNIDVDWEVLVDFKVNNFIKASLGSQLKYDNDVKTVVVIDEDADEYAQGGAKVQWRQLLGVGFVVDF
ncbi:conserved hypothetical protein (DUF3078) [Formosa agariphila KMM 3901]|uniref:DUF3078 domain-containing protein n=1 Tax=Formosa agariphila (strain DSM 15362 / KCTC 12365 / LMG 23005 / KMM 3901 / M-2Alg 35-1) TaxID=1347342 RepID=T2KK70_FORAG|nr:DUF3078 domain-containing protein [Formosa agariphila]CDF78404.1 conserved hypothetical protein (DUF3078) [Formosa agariphila KMM 3901]